MSWVSIIFLIIVFGAPAFQKALKAYSEWQEKSKRGNRLDYDERPSMDIDNQPMRVEEVDLSTMTMAQRIELARQRARQQSGGLEEVEAQARALARREEQARALRQQQQQADRQRQQQLTAREEARRRQLLEQSRRQQPAPQRQAPSQQARPTGSRNPIAQPPVARAVNRPGQRKAVTRTATPQTAAAARDPISAAGLSISSPIQAGTLGKSNRVGPAVFAGVSLQRAMILKEILDQPLALRENNDQRWA